MKKEIALEQNFLYLFCKKCWDYKKFEIKTVESTNNSNLTNFACTNCQRDQLVDLQLVGQYYEVLNEHNN